MEHSNTREIRAVLPALESFREHMKGQHIRLMSDNVITVAYLNNVGGQSMEITRTATSIWELCHRLEVMLTVRHVPGAKNCITDRLSRIQDAHEWKFH